MDANLRARVRAALERGHGPDCEEPDEDSRGRCVCEHAELAVELQLSGRYLAPGEAEHVDPPTDDMRQESGRV